MKVIVILLLLFYTRATGQNCDQTLQADNSQYGYRSRYGDERCEGTYKRYRSGEVISLVSFTEDNISFNSNDKSLLEISAPETIFYTDIYVQGVNFGMNSNISYRLDLMLSVKNSKKIPLKDVIIPLGIKSSNLGLYGYIIKKEEKIFIPVKAKAYDRYSTDSKYYNNNSYKIKFISSTNLSELSWYLIRTDEKISFFKQEYIKYNRPIFRDQAIEIEPDSLIKKLGGNDFIIYIKVIDKNGEAYVTNYSLHTP